MRKYYSATLLSRLIFAIKVIFILDYKYLFAYIYKSDVI